MLLQATLLPLTLTSVILFLLLELANNEVLIEEFLIPLECAQQEVFTVRHTLAEARGNAIQDDLD